MHRPKKAVVRKLDEGLVVFVSEEEEGDWLSWLGCVRREYCRPHVPNHPNESGSGRWWDLFLEARYVGRWQPMLHGSSVSRLWVSVCGACRRLLWEAG